MGAFVRKDEELTSDQRDAILRFKLMYGRTWKETLRTMWFKGTDGNQKVDGIDIGAELRQLRNNFGPKWLEKTKV